MRKIPPTIFHFSRFSGRDTNIQTPRSSLGKTPAFGINSFQKSVFRRVFIFIVGLFSTGNPSRAANSQEYLFTMDMIEAAHDCQWAREMEPQGDEGYDEGAEEILRQTKKLKAAAKILGKYGNNPSGKIRRLNQGVIQAVTLLISVNEAEMVYLKEKADQLPRPAKEWRRLAAQKETLWGMIEVSLRDLPDILMDARAGWKGPMPIPLVEKEDYQILRLIENYFQEDIDVYRSNQRAFSEGEQENLEKSMGFIGAVSEIQKSLMLKDYGPRKTRKSSPKSAGPRPPARRPADVRKAPGISITIP